jgi:phosphate transport system protein
LPRESFQHELTAWSGDTGLGREVEAYLGTMVEAMERHDENIASRELGVDQRFKRARGGDRRRVHDPAGQASSVARDLRLIYTVQAVTNHMVRSGTLCEHICRAIAETADAERDADLDAALLEMARGARDLFAQGLNIFEDRDIDRARDLEAADDKIDLLYSEAMNLVVNPTNGGAPEWRVRAALTVHYLERIADHGVDIGARTVFLVTGERMESAMRQYRDRHLDGNED